MIMYWWEWLFILVIISVIGSGLQAIALAYINRNKPQARHCTRCHKLIEEEARINQLEIDD